jgi:hypothetical protein
MNKQTFQQRSFEKWRSLNDVRGDFGGVKKDVAHKGNGETEWTVQAERK